jgi:dienelactone hydrolase
MLRGLATLSGMVFYRVDKPGVGDSEGVCGDADFRSELDGYRAAYRQLAAREDVDPRRIFVFGWSNGGDRAAVPEEKIPAAGALPAEQ